MMIRLLFVLSLLMFAMVPMRMETAHAQNTLLCDIVGGVPGFIPRDWWDKVQHTEKTVVKTSAGTITLRVCADGKLESAAHMILTDAARFLPVIANKVHVEYYQDFERTILVVPTNSLAPHELGMVNEQGVILVPPQVTDWVLIHELAHLWANNDAFGEAWMVEAYAEYVTAMTAQDLGLPNQQYLAAPDCTAVALQNWQPDGSVTGRCGYDVGRTLFTELATTIGSDSFQALLSGHGRVLDSLTLLENAEQLSGKDLTDIIVPRVFPADQLPWFELRRTARQYHAETQRLAQQLGYSLPGEIDYYLQQRQYDQAVVQLQPLLAALREASVLYQQCAALRLICPTISSRFPDPLAAQAELVATRQMLEGYQQLVQQAKQNSLQIPSDLVNQAGTLDQRATEPIAQARTLLDQGLALQVNCGAQTCANWRNAWESGQFDAAAQAIRSLEVVVNQAQIVEQRCAAARAGCRAIWETALDRDGAADLPKTMQQLTAVLDAEEALIKACESIACQQGWQAALATGDLATAQQNQADLQAILENAPLIESDCTAIGWPCGQGWQRTLEQAGIPEARQYLGKVKQTIAKLKANSAILEQVEQNALLNLIDDILDRNPNSLLQRSRQLFTDGDVDAATVLLDRAIEARTTNNIVYMGVAVLTMLFIGVIGWGIWSYWRKRPGKPGSPAAPGDDDLLKALLKKHP